MIFGIAVPFSHYCQEMIEVARFILVEGPASDLITFEILVIDIIQQLVECAKEDI